MGAKKKIKAALSPRSPTPPADDTLLDDLLDQLDNADSVVTQQETAHVVLEVVENTPSSPPTSPPTSTPSPSVSQKLKKSSKARFKAREERKEAAKAATYASTDPAADARIQQEAVEEQKAITNICHDLGLQLHEIQPDGHCLFSAIGDQLILLSILPGTRTPYLVTRRAAADYMMSHPDDFIPFLPCPEGEDGTGATEGGLITRRGLEQYCVSIRDTATWGGEPEILALSRAFNVPIHVVQWGTPPIVMHAPSPQHPSKGRVVYISYHRRMYGLGEHYNSLRPRGKSGHLPDLLKNTLMM